jgi:hypothetical protein
METNEAQHLPAHDHHVCGVKKINESGCLSVLAVCGFLIICAGLFCTVSYDKTLALWSVTDDAAVNKLSILAGTHTLPCAPLPLMDVV